MSEDYASRERCFAVVERERAEVERRRASAGGRDEAAHVWAAVLHERVAALHDRAADLHGRTAQLRSEGRMVLLTRRLAGNATRCAWCGAPIAVASKPDDRGGVDHGAIARAEHVVPRSPRGVEVIAPQDQLAP
jgi:hypothetical protein